MSPRLAAAGGHRGEHAGQRGGGVAGRGADGDPAGELGDGRAVLVGHHDRRGQVVAEEHLAFLDLAADVAVSPGRLGVGAGAGGLVGHRPGPGLDVGPVDGQRGAGRLERGGDAGFQQLVADLLQAAGGGAVGLGLGQRCGDEPGGVPGLAVGELVRAVLPVGDDAQAFLVGCGQAGQRLAGLGEVGRPPVGQGQVHADQQAPGAQLPGAARRAAAGPRSSGRRRRRR